jgi:O-antigen ligase
MLRRLVTVFFLLFVFTSTFSIALSQLSLGICAAFFVVAAVRERFNPLGGGLRWFWLAVGAYVGWLVLVCLLQDHPLHSINNIREEWLFIIIPIVAYLGQDRKTLDRVVTVLAVGLVLVSINALLSYVFRMEYHWGPGFVALPDTNPRVSGTFSMPLTFGNYLSVASLIVLGWALTQAERWSVSRIVALGGGVLGYVAVLLCGGRGPAVAGLIGLAVLLALSSRASRRWGIGVIVTVLIIGALMPSVRSRFTTELGYHFNPDWPGGRLFIWERSIEIVIDHPLTGIGPGNFDAEYKQRVGPEVTDRFWYQHAHNDFLEATVRSGVPGVVTFSLLWVALLGSFRRRWRESSPESLETGWLTVAVVGSLVFLVCSITEATFSDEEVRALLMLVWGIGLSSVYNYRRSGPLRT